MGAVSAQNVLQVSVTERKGVLRVERNSSRRERETSRDWLLRVTD